MSRYLADIIRDAEHSFDQDEGRNSYTSFHVSEHRMRRKSAEEVLNLLRAMDVIVGTHITAEQLLARLRDEGGDDE